MDDDEIVRGDEESFDDEDMSTKAPKKGLPVDETEEIDEEDMVGGFPDSEEDEDDM